MTDKLTAVRRALDNLLEQIEIDGLLIHSDACDCDVCQAIAAARAALKDCDTLLPLLRAAPDLYDGCNALLGLFELLSYRNDISDAVREILTESHRVKEAEAAIAKATGATA